jgi:hypothetical protein
MPSKRTLIVVVAVGLLLVGATPKSASAAITGNTYNFSAIWFDQNYQVDNANILDESLHGNFQIRITNLTPSDYYEYTYTGLNWNHWSYSPYYDEYNGSIAFQDNKVHFDLDTDDADENDLIEHYDFQTFPYFSEHHPGSMFFVNPVWSTHDTDWTSSVNDADTQLGVTDITQSTGEGDFSLRITMGIEDNHTEYEYMSGTLIITFSAAYDADGVLSTWTVRYVTSLSNDDHTTIRTVSQSFSRGAGAPLDPSMGTTLVLVGVAGVGCLVIGAAIGKKYLS